MSSAPCRATLVGALFLLAACAGRDGRVETLPAGADPRPSLVLVVADDLRADVLGVAGHPTVSTPHIDRLAAEGAYFRNAFVVSPACCPSRATLLTGTYGHVNGVPDNSEHRRILLPTVAELLRDAGYETAFIGKWHIGEGAEPRPGFDHWVAFERQGAYYDVELNVDGTPVQTHGYSTDILTDYAEDWIARRGSRPFLLILALKSVHRPFEPPPRHAQLYADAPVELPPSFHDPAEELPAALRDRFAAQLEEREQPGGEEEFREEIRSYWRMVPSVDDSVGRVRRALERRGLLDRTAFVFTSDNGYLLGEHRLRLKGRAYEAAIRVPLIVRYPPRARRPARISTSALNLDLAPTLLDLAGLSPPDWMQGRTLVPLLDGTASEMRPSWLFVQPHLESPKSTGVRTERWKYLYHPKHDGEEFLVDLVADPDERVNLAADPAHAEQLDLLRSELRSLLATYRAPPEWGPPPS